MKIQFPKTYCVYDLETTGLDTDTVEIIELGLKKVVEGVVSTRSWIVKQTKPLPQFSLDSGFTEEMVKEKGWDLHEVLDEFCHEVRGLPLVGHNIIRYDNKIMRRVLLERISARAKTLTPAEGCIDDAIIHAEMVVATLDEGRVVDTAGLFKASRLPYSGDVMWNEDHKKFVTRVMELRVSGLKFNLLHTCTELGIPNTDLAAHRAEGDVEMCDRIYRKLALE